MKPNTLQPLFLAALLSAQPACAAGFSDLEGRWRGSGWSRASADSAREAVRCTIRADASNNGLRIDLTGQCASPGRRVNVNAWLERGVDGSFAGRWSNPDGLGTFGLRGHGNWQEISMSFEEADPDTGERIAGTMVWKLSSEGFTISTALRELESGKVWQAGMITFGK